MMPPFDSWMAAVDRAVIYRTGVSVHDLADQCFHDWFDDGIRSTAQRGIPTDAKRLAAGRQAAGDHLSKAVPQDP